MNSDSSLSRKQNNTEKQNNTDHSPGDAAEAKPRPKVRIPTQKPDADTVGQLVWNIVYENASDIIEAIATPALEGNAPSAKFLFELVGPR